MTRARFDSDPLVTIPVGALRILYEAAQGTADTGDDALGAALNEVRGCCCAQGVTLEAADGSAPVRRLREGIRRELSEIDRAAARVGRAIEEARRP